MVVYVKVAVIVLGSVILSLHVGFVFVSNPHTYVAGPFIKPGIISRDALIRFVSCG